MMTVRPASHIHRLLLLLSAAGEFPARSLRLLGSERSYESLVHRLESVQQFRAVDGTDLGSYKLLNVSGRRERRTIRFYKGGLPLLNALDPAAFGYYMATTGGHRFSGSDAHVQRNHRVAEALAMCMAAGVESCPYRLPPLQKQDIRRTIPTSPSFYLAREIKRLDQAAELNKTIFTRLAGALFCPDACYPVYNTRGAAMKWSGMGEFKTAHHLVEVARMNAGLDRADHALLLGERMDVALQTLLESDRSRRLELRFDRIYPHVHFIPMDGQGVRQLKILTLPNWHEQMLSAIFPPELRLPGPGSMECDARRGDTLIFSHLDGDIARLIRLRQTLEYAAPPFEVLCYPWQVVFLREYLGGVGQVRLREVTMDALEEALGVAPPKEVLP